MKGKISLSQMFPSRSRRAFEKVSISVQGQIIEAEIEILVRRFLTSALLAYLEQSYLKQSHALAQEDLKHLDFAESTISAHYQHHDYSLASILRIQSQREEVSARLKNLERETALTTVRLRNIYRNFPVPLLEFPSTAPETYAPGKLENHPQNLWFLARIEQEKSKEELADSAQTPDFMLGAEYSFIDPISTAPRQGSDAFYLNFGLTLKLDPSRYRSQIEVAQIQQTTVKEQHSAWLLEQQLKEAELKTSFENASQTAGSLNGFIIPNLKKALESMRINYSSNPQRNAYELVETVRELLTARQKALLVWKFHWQALIQLTDLYDQNPPLSL